MPLSEEALARLTLAIDRLLDAEVLLPEDAEPLQKEADAVRRHLEGAAREQALLHIARLELAAAALVRTGLLDSGSASDLLQAARQLKDAGAA